MSLLTLGLNAGIPAGTTNRRAEGNCRLVMDETYGQPLLLRRVYGHTTWTKGIPYGLIFNVTYPGGTTQANATATSIWIAVANETLAAAGYGEVALAGPFQSAVTSGTVAAGAQVQVINSGVAFIDEGGTTAISSDACGVALTAASGNVANILLYGTRVNIASS